MDDGDHCASKEKQEEKNLSSDSLITRDSSVNQSESRTDTPCSIEIPDKSYRVYTVGSSEWQVESQTSMASSLSLSSFSILEQEYLRK